MTPSSRARRATRSACASAADSGAGRQCVRDPAPSASTRKPRFHLPDLALHCRAMRSRSRSQSQEPAARRPNTAGPPGRPDLLRSSRSPARLKSGSGSSTDKVCRLRSRALYQPGKQAIGQGRLRRRNGFGQLGQNQHGGFHSLPPLCRIRLGVLQPHVQRQRRPAGSRSAVSTPASARPARVRATPAFNGMADRQAAKAAKTISGSGNHAAILPLPD